MLMQQKPGQRPGLVREVVLDTSLIGLSLAIILEEFQVAFSIPVGDSFVFNRGLMV